ncbi:LCP family protein [Actinoplanes sp. NPDC051861]|uniref:LCP family protein n=1 Tax=Actinoplanes sp. NPDC051861 TaxID=3155170 RepID=UPI0034467C65
MQPVDAPEPGKHAAKKSRKKWKIALIVLLVPVILAGLGLIGAGWYLQSVENDIERVDAFNEVPEAARPQKEAAAGEAQNFLLLGSDSRDPENDGGSRSDTIIVLHINKAKDAAQLISIPRDTWVYIPKSANGKHGDTNSKINASFAWGGVPLMVQTVENYTGVRIDHVALVDFAGFKEIVDALGGVEVDVETSFTSTHSLNANSIRKFEKGPQQMDGAMALDYARERYAFKDGDFARIRHQQQVIKAILDKAVSGGVLTNPGRLNSFLKATTNTVSVDKDMNMVDMAMDLRHLRSENLGFYTSPTKGTGRIGDQSVVLPDKAKAKALFTAVRKDDVDTIKSLAETK